MASAEQKVKVVEHCEISPPPGSVPPTSLPLTFFDIPWLLFSPSQPLFFYELPHVSTTHFTTIILPNLKHSLSLTLQRFFPLAGNLTTPLHPTKPHLVYTEGDSISLTVAESTGDYFNHLTGHYPRHVRDFHHLVPQLEPPTVSSDPHTHPTLAIQITVFPNCGICIGFTFLNVLGDGRTFNNFLKSWASIFRLGIDSDLPVLNQFYDRSVISDPNGLEPIFLEEWWSLRTSQKEFMDTSRMGLKDMVRATFVMGPTHMEKLKQWIRTRSKKIFGSPDLHLTPYIITCAFVWACLTKARGIDNKEVCEELHYFGFIAGGITRLDYPVPTNYFGNCVAFGRPVTKRNELLGEDGIVFAAKSIGETTKKLDGDVLGGGKSWISDGKVLLGSELHVTVTGSPKVDLYELDFGWGRPRKIEEISIDRSRAVSLTESRDVEGGIEIGLALSKPKMDAFASLFANSFNDLL
ncbi:phenolic glucoside malonyltransferase 1-like [Cornus florida]|uniref:phenolic glucoside malonyltransferase 1-like n=1 Tax=Cornus florida TaxID=4283 RepID=UPI00289BB92B|nr:phenolic glucoside malonyltransferase 1-like [Cornus florida]